MNTTVDFVFNKRKAYSILVTSTLTFVVTYMVWMMFAVVGVPIKKALHLNATEFGLLTSIPVLVGSLIRMPLGMWVDRFGGRIVMFVLLLFTAIPIWLVSCASSYWEFLVLGGFIGMVGGSYGVGIPYIAHWFPKHRQGLAMSIYGAGSTGATLNNLIAPLLVATFGWMFVPQVYAYLMVIAALLFWLLSYQDPSHIVAKNVSFMEQLRALKDPDVMRLSLYYAIAFGAFAALSLWMVQYYVGEFNLSLKEAALLAACFTFPNSILRVLGGWFADKYGGRIVTLWMLRASCVCLLLLSIPSADLMLGTYHLHCGLNPYIFALIMFVQGIAWAFGKASVFKCISEDYITKIGAVSGIVGATGGVGGFVWLIIFGVLYDLTDIRSSAFMFLFLVACLALKLMPSVQAKQS